MREREGDDLPGIGRIGEHLLVAGHRGIEADLADRVAGRAESGSFQHGAVRKHQERRGFRLAPAGFRRPRGSLCVVHRWPTSLPPHVIWGESAARQVRIRAGTAKGIAMLRDDINNALKTAMKAQDQRRVSTLRMVNSTIKNADIEARGAGKGPLGDDELNAVMAKMIKQRQESVELYDKGGRADLATQEREEIA